MTQRQIFGDIRTSSFFVPNTLIGSDIDQAIVRVILGSAALGIILIYEDVPGSNFRLIGTVGIFFYSLAAYIVVSLAITIAAVRSLPPQHGSHFVRRVIGVVLDLSFSGLGLFMTREYSLIMFSVFISVIIGYGFRFGLRYLIIGVVVGLIVVSLLGIYSPFFARNQFLTFGIAVGVVLVPTYAAFLLAKYQKALFQLDESNRARSRFIANMSHELRTPLNAISLNVETLLGRVERNLKSRKELESLKIIKESSSYLSRLVNRVLDISSNEAGVFTLGEPAKVDFYSSLSEAVRIASAQTKLKAVRVYLNVSPTTPRFITGWQQQVQEVLVNVIGNAAKFTTQGEIVVRVNAISDSAGSGSGQIFVEVDDTGPGIDSQDLSSIFEPFVLGDDSRVRGNEGTGIGLTLTRQYLQAMGGSIEINQKPSNGTTVRVNFPFGLAEDHGSFSEPLDFLAVSERSVPFGAFKSITTVSVADCLENLIQPDAVHCVFVDELVANEFLEAIDSLPKEKNPVLILVSSELKDSFDRRFLCCVSEINDEVLGDVAALSAFFSADVHSNFELKPKRLLLIDDNTNNLLSAQITLENAGHFVDVASSSQTGLKQLAENDFDLIFVDMHMPELDGIQTIREARNLLGDALPPVVMLTADATRQAYEDAKAAGVEACLTKPISSRNLINAVAEHAKGLASNRSHDGEELVNESKQARLELDNLLASGVAQEKLVQTMDKFSDDFNQSLVQCCTYAARKESVKVKKLIHKLQGSAAAMHFTPIVTQLRAIEHLDGEALCDALLANAASFQTQQAEELNDLKDYLCNRI